MPDVLHNVLERARAAPPPMTIHIDLTGFPAVMSGGSNCPLARPWMLPIWVFKSAIEGDEVSVHVTYGVRQVSHELLADKDHPFHGRLPVPSFLTPLNCRV